ncbi:MmpS family transport accessory protein [Streptomyces sp. NPDC048172]|uniref:MmpS family transport accessory protein n=1 Tax=Streptomyces sp. NPDC048172 TaxID=3365505 RepID=UPI003723403D
MRTQRAAAAVCLIAAAALLATGCSGGGGKKKGSAGGDTKVGSGADQTATVEIRMTGDSPAGVYVPGILGERGANSKDLDLEHVKTPWSKKFKAVKGDMINMQAASEDPKAHISCQVLVDGKVKKQKTEKAKEGSTLVSHCSTTV